MDNKVLLDHVSETDAANWTNLPLRRTFLDNMWRWALLLLMFFAFSGAMIVSMLPEKEVSEICLEVPILSSDEMDRFQDYSYHDYSASLKFQNEVAAVDKKNSVIYITQKIGNETSVKDLIGKLTIDIPGKKLFFAPDEYWNDLKGAVRSGHGFKLMVAGFRNRYMQYEVVFTTLPVISIHGKTLYKNEESVNVQSGAMVLWDPEELAAGKTGVISSHLTWNERGGTSKYRPKKPQKLSLKNMDNTNNSEDLLSLGADDDWILNPMSMEDSKIREKMFMDLWNEMVSQTDYNYPMSTGKYLEVLINNKYQGLHILQRRLDEKYLELEKNSVLVKVKQKENGLQYEFFPRSVEALPQSHLSSFFVEKNCTNLNVENFVDVNLFLQAFSSVDNEGYKNMYYLYDYEDDDYSISLIPWDTDMILGSIWDRDVDKFTYNYEKSINYIVERREMPVMQELHSDLDYRLCTRWKELRQTILSYENITDMMAQHLETIAASGAGVRDQNAWGFFYEGEDTIEGMYRFVEERLMYLDSYYVQ